VADNGPDAAARRRTDGPDPLWGGASPLSDSTSPGRAAALRAGVGDSSRRPPVPPVLVPEARAVRVPSATSRTPRMADHGRPAARPRPPIPPVPPPVGPRTSAAPFAAVPSPAPEREGLRPSATALEERPSLASLLRDIPSPAGPPQLSQPVPDLSSGPDSSWSDGEHGAPWSTGRGEIRAPRERSGRPDVAPVVERRASRLPAGGVRPSTGPGESPCYGDWTKPSGPGRMPSAPVPPLPAVPSAPMTSAIPDRNLAGRRDTGSTVVDDRLDDERHGDRYEDDRYEDERHEEDRRGPDSAVDLDEPALHPSGPITSTVVGGRAALRAEREAREATRVAAETARRKAAGDLDELDRPRRPRRVLKGLLAVAGVAAVVAGVYTVATPGTEEAATKAPAPSSAAASAPTSAPEVTAALPSLDTERSVAAETAPATPVRVPVTVLNATDINGLAADVSNKIKAKGWQTADPNGYPKDDVAASTVFFTEGDEKQRQAALQLVEQFPQLTGPAPRFFEVPAEVDAPGLVVVLAADWKP
jgi:hypothetical protein